MNFFLMIMTEDNKPFSHPKKNTPKMYNAMVEIAKEYVRIYKKNFKVKRVIKTKQGWKPV